jgi:hypothetical protein
MITRFGLATLALLALVFQPIYSASSDASAASNVNKLDLRNIVGHLTDSDPAMQSSILRYVDYAEGSVANLQKNFAETLNGDPNDADACLKFIKSLNRDITQLMKDMKADYYSIKTHNDHWKHMSACITMALMSLSPSHLKQITATEALNYAVVMTTFNRVNSILFKHREGLERLGSCFTPSQWLEFAHWTLYVSHPDNYSLPQKLYATECYSREQQLFIIKTAHDVIVEGQSFVHNGFNRPECKAPDDIDNNYLDIPICCFDWCHESVNYLSKILVCFFKTLTCSKKEFNYVIDRMFPALCRIIMFLCENNAGLREVAVSSLVSDTALDRFKGKMHKETGEDCASVLIQLSRLMNSEAFNIALKTLNQENFLFALNSIKACKDLSYLFAEISKQMVGILNSPSRESQSTFDRIRDFLELAKELPPNHHSAPIFVKINYLMLGKLFGTINVSIACSLRNSGMYDDLVETLMKWERIRYLIADQGTRTLRASELALTIGFFVRERAKSALTPSQLNDTCAIRSSMKHIQTPLEAYFSRVQLQQIFTEACKQIDLQTRFSDAELSNMIVLATAVFDDQFSDDLEEQIAILFMARLLKGGVLDGDYMQKTGYLIPPTLTKVYLSAFSKLHADPCWKSGKKNVALRNFVCWLIENNHAPRSIELILSKQLR